MHLIGSSSVKTLAPFPVVVIQDIGLQLAQAAPLQHDPRLLGGLLVSVRPFHWTARQVCVLWFSSTVELSVSSEDHQEKGAWKSEKSLW